MAGMPFSKHLKGWFFQETLKNKTTVGMSVKKGEEYFWPAKYHWLQTNTLFRETSHEHCGTVEEAVL